MKCYLLLRDNLETGPYTFDEITAQALKPSDLIWIEGQSVAWKYPTEIEALQLFVSKESFTEIKKQDASAILTTSKGVFVALPSQYTSQRDFQEEKTVELETRFSQPLEKLKEDYNAPKENTTFFFPKTFSKPHSALWLGCVFAGLLFSAFLIKKIVDNYDENVSGIPAAALPVNDMAESKTVPEENQYQNALTTEVIPVDTATMKPVKKAPVKVNLKKLVQLEANDYQVGLFGGVKNLRLLLTNKSAFVLDKVKIDVDYLKPNGDVIKTEHLLLTSVSPKSGKSLKVASQNRGVKVSYRITDIKSKQHTETLLHL